MEVRALISFGGQVSMTKGEIKKISKTVGEDLVKAGYVEEIPAKPVKKTK